eukprot:SM000032S12152  [mRNA]  locus=s32:838099:845078:+ [translate_table: standard]
MGLPPAAASEVVVDVKAAATEQPEAVASSYRASWAAGHSRQAAAGPASAGGRLLGGEQLADTGGCEPGNSQGIWRSGSLPTTQMNIGTPVRVPSSIEDGGGLDGDDAVIHSSWLQLHWPSAATMRLVVMLWLAIGLAITATVLVEVSNASYAGQRRQLELACRDWAVNVKTSFEHSSSGAMLFTEMINKFYLQKRRSALTEDTFQQLANSTAYDRPLLNGMAFLQKVTQAERPAFEKRKGSCLRSYFENSCLPTAKDYAACIFLYRVEKGPSLPALPFLSDAKGVLEAVDPLLIAESQDPVLSAPIQDPSSRGYGILTLGTFPVHRTPSPSASTAAENKTTFAGWLLVGILFNEVMEQQYKSAFQHEKVVARLVDATNPQAPQLVGKPQHLPSLDDDHEHYPVQLDLDLNPDRDYVLECRFTRQGFVPRAAVQWAGAALIIASLSAYIMWATSSGIETMRISYERLKLLKDDMKLAKQAAEMASMAKGAFLTTMSHEMRTPMNGIIGMLNLLKDTKLDVVQLDYVETARISGRALCALISDVLDLSKIEAGHLELENIPMDIREVVDNVLSMVASSWDAERTCRCGFRLKLTLFFARQFADCTRAAGVQLGLLVDPSVPYILLGDPLRFCQILINLLANACKFTRDGHIAVCIRMAEPEEVVNHTIAPYSRQPSLKSASIRCKTNTSGHETLSGYEAVESCSSWSRVIHLVNSRGRSMSEAWHKDQHVRLIISIEDTGLGIPDAAQRNIFKPFCQADTSTTRTHGGTGIGLSICKRLVNMMGGDISFVSRSGIGTTFFFDVSLLIAPPGSQSASSLQRSSCLDAAAKVLQGGTVLVVDDRPARRAIAASILLQLGVSVHFYSSLAEVGPHVAHLAHCHSPGAGPTLPSKQPQAEQDATSVTCSQDDCTQDLFTSYSLRPSQSQALPTSVGQSCKQDRLSESCPWDAPSSELPYPFPSPQSTSSCTSSSSSQTSISSVDTGRLAAPSGVLVILVEADVWAAERQLAREVTAACQLGGGVQTRHAYVHLLSPSAEPENEALKDGFNSVLLKPLRTCAVASGLVLSHMATAGGNSRVAPHALPHDNGAIAGGGLSLQELQIPVMDSGNSLASLKEKLTQCLSGKRCLVVDDNAVNRKVMSKMLLRYGVSVDLAEGGAKAVAMLTTVNPGLPAPYDIVFMDLQMPEMDGYEAVKHFREHEANTEYPTTSHGTGPVTGTRLPVVALTADIVVGTRERECEAYKAYMTMKVENLYIGGSHGLFFTYTAL